VTHPVVITLLATLIVAAPSRMRAEKSAPQPAVYHVVKACSLMSAAEVKKLAPWPSQLDQFPPEEEAIGTRGSSCNYPTAFIQVMAFSQGFLDAAIKSGATESVNGVGDLAYIRNNRDRYAELVARVGPHILTVQLNMGQNEAFEAAKPRLIAVAQAFAARLARQK
jgi:hypothetical protein